MLFALQRFNMSKHLWMDRYKVQDVKREIRVLKYKRVELKRSELYII